MTRPHSRFSAENTSSTSSNPPASAVIVVVDDDPSLVEVLTDLLATEGYAVEGFTDPTAALARLKRDPRPDLAVVDCVMPYLSGTELCAALAESGIEVPVLLMTALSDPSFCVHPGGEAVLNKPFVLEDLLLEMEARLRPRSGPRSDRRLRAARM